MTDVVANRTEASEDEEKLKKNVEELSEQKDLAETKDKALIVDEVNNDNENKTKENNVDFTGSINENEDDNDNEENQTDAELEEILQHENEDKYKGRTCQLPDFAVICSFLEIFGPLLELPSFSISDLEQAIDCTRKFSTQKCM